MTVGIDTDFLVRLAVLEHSGHESAKWTRDRHLADGDRFAIAPQVVAELVHVVTDPRRFEAPFTTGEALAWARAWSTASEVDCVAPSPEAVTRFFDLMLEHQLGRKRILDTMLAATYLAAGVDHLITGNPSDYRVFEDLVLVDLS